MKKLLVGFLVLLGIGGVLVYTQLNSVIKTGVETAGPEFMSVDVSVGSVSISPLSGKVNVKDLAIGQPDGFGEGPMVQLGEFSMKVETGTLLNDHVIVDEIVIDQPMFDARLIGSQSNFQALQKKLTENMGPSEVGGQPLTLTIRSLAVRAPQIMVQAEGGIVDVDEDVKLADFTLSNLGTDEKGLSPQEIARHVMDTLEPQITKALVAAGAEGKLKDIARNARGELEQKAGSFLKKLRNKGKSGEDDNN